MYAVIKTGGKQYSVKVGDVVSIAFGEGSLKFRVLNLKETVRKDEAASLYEIINE